MPSCCCLCMPLLTRCDASSQLTGTVSACPHGLLPAAYPLVQSRDAQLLQCATHYTCSCCPSRRAALWALLLLLGVCLLHLPRLRSECSSRGSQRSEHM